jgi:hypothetical protein
VEGASPEAREGSKDVQTGFTQSGTRGISDFKVFKARFFGGVYPESVSGPQEWYCATNFARAGRQHESINNFREWLRQHTTSRGGV